MKETVKFGRYFTTTEMDDIEWIVLEKNEDGSMLLISKHCVESFQYEYRENKNKKPSWRNGIIRAWLNNYFLNLCFTAEEQEKMQPIPVKTRGAVLDDKIILLSAEEVERYLPEEADRKAKPTKWANRNKDGEKLYTEKGYCCWFLRDPSKLFEGNYTDVGPDGKIDLYGGDFYLGGVQGVRPVILVKS